jgi:hypothetical protein
VLKNSLGVPLTYVICKVSMYHNMDDHLKKIIMNTKLGGAVFHSDSQRILMC